MKKRIMAILLVFCMIFSFAPTTVFATTQQPMGDPSPMAADAITITVNSVPTEYGGATLEAAIAASNVAVDAVTALTITAGTVTAADWTWFGGIVKDASDIVTSTAPVLTKLQTFTVDAAVTAVADIPDGASGKPVFPTDITTVTIPSVDKIGGYAFSGCAALETATIPKATKMGTEAFSYCGLLASATFPEVTTIGPFAFLNCTSLATATSPKAEYILMSAFYGCTSLTTVSFPVAKEIRIEAFSGCTKLKTASFPVAEQI